jgi:hypothetical protein
MHSEMTNVHELIGLARDLADEIVGVVAGLLSAGVPNDDVLRS